jgi:hypothetical protein
LLGCRKLLISHNIEFEQQAHITEDTLKGGAPPTNASESSSSRPYAIGAQEMQRLEAEIKQLKIEKSQKEKQLQSLTSKSESQSEQLQSTQLEFF